MSNYTAAAKRSGRTKNKKSRKNNNGNRPVISLEAENREETGIDVPIAPDKEEIKEERQSAVTNAISVFNTILVGGVIACGAVYMTCFSHEKKADDENRYLAKFPEFSLSSYISGDYTSAIAEYFDDTVHGRSRIKRFISDKLLPLKGRPYGGDDEVELYGTAFEHTPQQNEPDDPVTVPVTTATVTTTMPAAATEETSGAPETSETPKTSEDPGTSETPETSEAEKTTSAVQTTAARPQETERPVTTVITTKVPVQGGGEDADGEVTNNILIVNKRGITLYGGGWGGEVTYASYVNEYKAALPDVNVWSMPLPTPCSFYLPDKYKNLAASEKADFDNMAAHYSGVKAVDAWTALSEHTDEPIYSRTDHHWQPLGAYYAAQEFAKSAGVPFDDLSTYEKVVLPGYVGTLYGFTKSTKLLNNPEDFVYYKTKNNVTVTQYDKWFKNPFTTSLYLDPSGWDKSAYYLVFGMDDNIRHVKTECKNGRTLIIFKDSYGNALLPFLTGSFENIYLCDIRYFGINPIQFAKQVGATDMLFSMCSYSAVGGNKSHIHNNLCN